MKPFVAFLFIAMLVPVAVQAQGVPIQNLRMLNQVDEEEGEMADSAIPTIQQMRYLPAQLDVADGDDTGAASVDPAVDEVAENSRMETTDAIEEPTGDSVPGVQIAPSQINVLIPASDERPTSTEEAAEVEMIPLQLRSVSPETIQLRTDLVQKLQTPGDDRAAAVFMKLGEIKGESNHNQSQDENERVAALATNEVHVSGVAVRGWDVKTKEEIVGNAPEAVSVRTNEDLALLASAVAEQDAAIEDISFNYRKIEVAYQTNGKLFWFIPIPITIHAAVDRSAEGTRVNQNGELGADRFKFDRVRVKFPWYRFLMKLNVHPDDLQSAIENSLNSSDFVKLNPQPEPPSPELNPQPEPPSADLNPQPEPPSAGFQSSVQNQAAVFSTIVTILQSLHRAM